MSVYRYAPQITLVLVVAIAACLVLPDYRQGVSPFAGLLIILLVLVALWFVVQTLYTLGILVMRKGLVVGREHTGGYRSGPTVRLGMSDLSGLMAPWVHVPEHDVPHCWYLILQDACLFRSWLEVPEETFDSQPYDVIYGTEDDAGG